MAVRRRQAGRAGRRAQQGAVLAVALIFLVVLFLAGAVTIRTTQSSEGVSGAARTGELAFQAAEIALRHCERSLVDVIHVAKGDASTYTTTFKLTDIQTRDQAGSWQVMTNWDDETPTVPVYTLPLDLVNVAATPPATFKRAPECMVAPVPTVKQGDTTLSDKSSFLITVRGFGPEVAAVQPGPNARRPQGTEVWLQSNVILE
ncbi:pilus assembly PilX family protein [Ramlibacter humi]|nr:PilX N-terminal domain-containing pilus assembly protein [Ramlibacter humi]